MNASQERLGRKPHKRDYKRYHVQAFGSAYILKYTSYMLKGSHRSFLLVRCQSFYRPYSDSSSIDHPGSPVTRMFLLAIILLPLIASLSHTLALRDAALVLAKPSSNSSSLEPLEPLPNPFPIPGTDITIEFLPQPTMFAPQPPRTDVLVLFQLARADLQAYIRVQGDGPIMGNNYEVDYGKVEMILTSSNMAADPVKYSDVLSVLSGIAIKMSREGYRNRAVRVFRTGQPDIIGHAAVYRPGIIRDIST